VSSGGENLNLVIGEVMIFSKMALQVVQVTEVDKDLPVFNTVLLRRDGSVVAGNRKTWVWVSSLPADKRKVVPLSERFLIDEITVWADSISKLIRAIPRDTQFKGLLEHVEIHHEEDGSVKAEISDGTMNHAIDIRVSNLRMQGWQEVFRNAAASMHNIESFLDPNEIMEIVLNRKRLAQLLGVLEKVMAYDGSFSPAYWYFAQDGSVLMRCKNELNGQRMVGVIGAQECDEYPLNEEEEQLLYGDE
jgi:hypothetical protein